MLFNNAVDRKKRLLDEVDVTRERIRHAENMFDFTGEPELIESAILEIESARKKYNYLLKKIKLAELEST